MNVRRPREKLAVLLIEDNLFDEDFILRAFGRVRPGLPIRVVSNGEAAIAYLRGEAPYQDRRQNPVPSMILVDLGLPGMSGLEVLNWIRSRPEYRDTVVVVLTASNLSADLKGAYERGCNSFLAKPTNGLDFVEMMGTLCSFWEMNIR